MKYFIKLLGNANATILPVVKHEQLRLHCMETCCIIPCNNVSNNNKTNQYNNNALAIVLPLNNAMFPRRP